MSAKGKRLVAKLRATAGVRDAEALAAWIGRYHKLRGQGKSPKAAAKAAGGKGKAPNSGKSKPKDKRNDETAKGSGLEEGNRELEPPSEKYQPKAEDKQRVSELADLLDDPFDDDDPFNDPFDGASDEEDPEEAEQRKYEEKLLRDMEKADRQRLRGAVLEAGGLQTRDDLREEYREIPNTYKRKNGLPGDEMAEYLATYFPEFGVQDERDLIDYLSR